MDQQVVETKPFHTALTSSRASPSDAEPVSILLVDDRQENLMSLEAVLEELDQNLVRATSGDDALRALLDQEFAVILMDVMMPGMDGYETADLIRQRETTQHTPIVFVTAINHDDAHIAKGYEHGAVDYIFKPIDPHILRSKVQVFIELYRSRRAMQQFNEELEQCVHDRTQDLQVANQRLQEEIEDRKRAEAEVRSLNEELEARVRARTAELEDANRELEAFSYSVSHDLRSPLRKIESFSSFLIEDYEDELDEQAQNYLDRIGAASKHMSQLIEDLLKLSRVSNNPLVVEAVHLSEMVGEIVEDLEHAFPDHDVHVEIEEGVQLEGDPRLLYIAMQNLLSNAWKFTTQEAEPQIRFGVRAQDNGKDPVYFVQDNGVGFDMKHAEKMFTPFQRLHTADEFPGTGIGLAIVQRAIRRHGGRIWPQAEEGHGATFCFT
ncbi:MAG TPA: response regulator, partial [Rhodothermales bacterium]|nr:response regulator [Rhodothermales bacterium]